MRDNIIIIIFNLSFVILVVITRGLTGGRGKVTCINLYCISNVFYHVAHQNACTLHVLQAKLTQVQLW